MRIEKIAEFMQEHSPFWYMEDTKWDLIISWYHHFNCLCVIENEGEIKAVAMARPVTNLEHGKEAYSFNPLGDAVYVDHTVCLDSTVRCQLYEAMLKAFGNKTFVIFDRKNKKKPKQYRLNKFMKTFCNLRGDN